MGLLVGAVPAVGEQQPGSEQQQGTARQAAERVIRLWRRLGLPDETCARQAVITPGCGLAGATPPWARTALERCREAARILPELIEETEKR